MPNHKISREAIPYDAVPYDAFAYQAIAYDYEYIGPAKNAVSWLDLSILALFIVAIAVIVRGVIKDWRAARRSPTDTTH